MIHIYVNRRVEATSVQQATLVLTINTRGALVALDGGASAPLPDPIQKEVLRIAEMAPQFGRDAFRHDGVIYDIFTITTVTTVP